MSAEAAALLDRHTLDVTILDNYPFCGSPAKPAGAATLKRNATFPDDASEAFEASGSAAGRSGGASFGARATVSSSALGTWASGVSVSDDGTKKSGPPPPSWRSRSWGSSISKHFRSRSVEEVEAGRVLKQSKHDARKQEEERVVQLQERSILIDNTPPSYHQIH